MLQRLMDNATLGLLALAVRLAVLVLRVSRRPARA
jgi:hypothetical protein